MQQYGVVVLKNSREVLKKEAIEKINYPYLLTEPDDNGQYLACTIGACFAYDKDFEVIKAKIEELGKEK